MQKPNHHVQQQKCSNIQQIMFVYFIEILRIPLESFKDNKTIVISLKSQYLSIQ